MKTHDRSVKGRFTPRDRKRLQRALEATREARLYRRLEALLLLAEGHSLSESARRVRCSRLSVRRWALRYLQDHDAAALADGARRGRPRTAEPLSAEQLGALLAQDPRQYGYRATSWTVPLLATYLRTHRQLSVSVRTLRRRLHEARFRWKRPRHVYREPAAHVGHKKGG